MRNPPAIYVVVDDENRPMTFHTSKRDVENMVRVHRTSPVRDITITVLKYIPAPQEIWHWAKKGEYSKCLSISTSSRDDHLSTDTYLDRINCLRCMKTNRYKAAVKAACRTLQIDLPKLGTAVDLGVVKQQKRKLTRAYHPDVKEKRK